MQRMLVISSMIRSVGYDELHSLLEIEFTSGKIYQYDAVPEEVYRGLMSAGSKGRYFEEQINDRFRYSRM
jgi:KTSC domain-containing protein